MGMLILQWEESRSFARGMAKGPTADHHPKEQISRAMRTDFSSHSKASQKPQANG